MTRKMSEQPQERRGCCGSFLLPPSSFLLPPSSFLPDCPSLSTSDLSLEANDDDDEEEEKEADNEEEDDERATARAVRGCCETTMFRMGRR